MGEYKNLVLGGKSLSKKKQPDAVEDFTVLRENLLKIEFRNIELEEINA
jgi:hypothetical protein